MPIPPEPWPQSFEAEFNGPGLLEFLAKLPANYRVVGLTVAKKHGAVWIAKVVRFDTLIQEPLPLTNSLKRL